MKRDETLGYGEPRCTILYGVGHCNTEYWCQPVNYGTVLVTLLEYARWSVGLIDTVIHIKLRLLSLLLDLQGRNVTSANLTLPTPKSELQHLDTTFQRRRTSSQPWA
jgi:hypothetical protein